MKLLFDNNLSHKLVPRLQDIFPGSTHVMLESLDEVPDEIIWGFAKANGFTIVSKDADYNEINLIKGFPPKVVWLSRVGWACTCTHAHHFRVSRWARNTCPPCLVQAR